MSAAAVVCAFVLAGADISPQNGLFLMGMFILTGGLLNAVQTTMYALAAHVFPTEIRSTGVGFAVAVGRIGNVLAATVAALLDDVDAVTIAALPDQVDAPLQTFAIDDYLNLITLEDLPYGSACQGLWSDMPDTRAR